MIKKPISALFISLVFILSTFTFLPKANGENPKVAVVLDGEVLDFDVPAQIIDGRTMVPMRAIFEKLGMLVTYDPATKKITATKKKNTIIMEIGKNSFTKNGEEIALDTPPQIDGGRTLVPLRALVESLNLKVSWDGATYTANLETADEHKDESWKDNLVNVDLTNKTIKGEGAKFTNDSLLITKGGDYELTGNFSGYVHVNTKDRVKLRLSGVNIKNENGPAIFFEDTDKGFITISDGTQNYLEDGSEYSIDAKAALFSNDDLEIKGKGTLNIKANYNHGIKSDDDITIENGNINITSVNDGINANDGIQITGGNITITAKGDGISSDGYLEIFCGNINITTTGEIQVNNNQFPGIFGGGRQGGPMTPPQQWQNPQNPQWQPPQGQNPPQQGMEFVPPNNRNLPPNQQTPIQENPQIPNAQNNAQEETNSTNDASSKGLKARTNLVVSGGTITLNTTDHAVHSQDLIIIYGGAFDIQSQYKKGFSGHGNVYINGGDIIINKCTEGIESKAILTIQGGNIRILSSDDGLNTGGGGQFFGGFRGQNNPDAGKDKQLNILGGYIYINSGGDGVDSNGNIYMTGGTLIVCGPTVNMESALDTEHTCIVEGGTIIAAGSIGMAVAPTEGSTQYSVHIGFDQGLPAGTIIRIEDETGENVLTYKLKKQAQSFVYSSDKLQKGKTYTIYTGGFAQGDESDGIIENAQYQGGTKYESFTVSNFTTNVGTGFRGGFGNWNRPMR